MRIRSDSYPLSTPMLWCLGMTLARGDCCGRLEAITDGYYCHFCEKFFHKRCSDEASEYIQHLFHSIHTLQLQHDLRARKHTAIYIAPNCLPPKVINVPEIHPHKLTHLRGRIEFSCAVMCGRIDDESPYKCHECNIAYHVDCVSNLWKVKQPSEVNHPYHSLHPLKLLKGQPPDYSDGKCRLSGSQIDDGLFYHCSSCNFSLDICCVLYPPPQSLVDLKAHDHQLTLLPRLDSFTCNACSLKGDRSPYVCFQCDFIIHQDCLTLPRIININQHDHRVSRTYVLGVVNFVCEVCRKKVDWTCGGYACQKCPGYVVHSKCATRKDVWNGKELEGVPEEIEDT